MGTHSSLPEEPSRLISKVEMRVTWPILSVAFILVQLLHQAEGDGSKVLGMEGRVESRKMSIPRRMEVLENRLGRLEKDSALTNKCLIKVKEVRECKRKDNYDNNQHLWSENTEFEKK